MNQEKGIDIANCWKEFSGEIRKIFPEKFQGHQQNSVKSTSLNHLEETTATLRFSSEK